MSSGEKEISFEQALTRLEEVVKELESGGLTLVRSLELFEEGIRLAKICEEHLNAAEQRITILNMDEKGEVIQKQVDSLSSTGGGFSV